MTDKLLNLSDAAELVLEGASIRRIEQLQGWSVREIREALDAPDRVAREIARYVQRLTTAPADHSEVEAARREMRLARSDLKRERSRYERSCQVALSEATRVNDFYRGKMQNMIDTAVAAALAKAESRIAARVRNEISEEIRRVSDTGINPSDWMRDRYSMANSQ